MMTHPAPILVSPQVHKTISDVLNTAGPHLAPMVVPHAQGMRKDYRSQVAPSQTYDPSGSDVPFFLITFHCYFLVSFWFMFFSIFLCVFWLLVFVFLFVLLCCFDFLLLFSLFVFCCFFVLYVYCHVFFVFVCLLYFFCFLLFFACCLFLFNFLDVFWIFLFFWCFLFVCSSCFLLCCWCVFSATPLVQKAIADVLSQMGPGCVEYIRHGVVDRSDKKQKQMYIHMYIYNGAYLAPIVLPHAQLAMRKDHRSQMGHHFGMAPSGSDGPSS